MPVENGDILRAVVQFRAGDTSTRVQGVFHFRIDPATDPTDTVITADLKQWLETMYSDLAAMYDDNFVGETIRVINATKREVVGDDAFTFSGAVEGDVMPPQVAALLIAPTKTLGIQGRKYFGPFLETANDDGNLTAAALAAVDSFGANYTTNYLGPVSANDYVPVLVRYVAKLPSVVTDLVDGRFRTIPQYRTQRRRTAGVGLT